MRAQISIFCDEMIVSRQKGAITLARGILTGSLDRQWFAKVLIFLVALASAFLCFS
jgi:hypothetical protein